MINRYLTSLEKGSRKRSKEALSAEMDRVQETILTTDNPLERLQAIQRRIELGAQLDAPEEDLEAGFCEVAGRWAKANGVSWKAWREMGVPSKVLVRAGIERSAS